MSLSPKSLIIHVSNTATMTTLTRSLSSSISTSLKSRHQRQSSSLFLPPPKASPPSAWGASGGHIVLGTRSAKWLLPDTRFSHLVLAAHRVSPTDGAIVAQQALPAYAESLRERTTVIKSSQPRDKHALGRRQVGIGGAVNASMASVLQVERPEVLSSLPPLAASSGHGLIAVVEPVRRNFAIAERWGHAAELGFSNRAL